jgi:hypothetical protein
MKKEKNDKAPKKNSALAAASLGRSATEHAHRHSNTGLASTGTNISYEGATAPGAGGSAGTGYASGKEATGEKVKAASDSNETRKESPAKTSNAVKAADTDHENEGYDEETADELELGDDDEFDDDEGEDEGDETK